MKLTFNEVNNILKTLPIGYYIGRKVDTILNDDSSVSFYVPIEDRIEISFEQVTTALSKISEESDVEELVRSILYHEVSHAFLTPKRMKVTDVINIFEDERIESLLRSYYTHTDFRKTVRLINDEHSATSAINFFYDIVRFRKGPSHLVNKVDDIIFDHKSLNRLSGSDWCDRSVKNYIDAVNEFYEQVYDYWSDHCDEISNKLDAKINNASDEMSNTLDTNIDDASNEDMKSMNGKLTAADKDSEKSVLTDDEIKTVFANPYNCSDFNDKIKAILQKIKTFESRNGSAINAYSGVFNPRAASRSDYRFFLQENRLGSAKAFSKFHINLFIDNSGSFWESDIIVNQLLKALRDFEKSNSNFSFDLVTINTKIVVKNHHDLEFKSDGGNNVPDEIFSVYSKLQRPDCKNYNIVLFDGDAVSDAYGSRKMKEASNFKAFDHKNCFIISDYDNEWILNKFVKVAKTKLISSGYASVLESEILKALNSIV